MVKKEKKREPTFFSRLIFYFLTVSSLAVAAYTFLFSDFAKIKNISVQGNTSLAADDIQAAIREFISGKYMKLIPAESYALVSKNKLTSQLERRFRKIKQTEIKKIFPDSLAVAVIERESLILWCSGGPCYAIDDTGVAYRSVDLDAPEAIQNNLIMLVNTGAQPVAIGEKVLDSANVEFILRLREKLAGENLPIGKEWKTPSQVSEEVVVKTQEGWNIYFSSKIEPAKSWRMLKTFLEEEIKEDRDQLEYADLRVENKVFYKLKPKESSANEELEEKNPETKKEKNKKD